MKQNKNRTPLIMALTMLVSIVMTVVCILLYKWTKYSWLYYSGIVIGMIAVHFVIMHMAAPIAFFAFGRRFNYNSFWFKPKKFEKPLYEFLRVKRWKTHVAAYNQNEYSIEMYGTYGVIMNMCYAEVVHELIFVMSYLPILFGIYISNYLLLFALCCLFSCSHLIFIIIQRYNRPRVVKLYEKQNR